MTTRRVVALRPNDGREAEGGGEDEGESCCSCCPAETTRITTTTITSMVMSTCPANDINLKTVRCCCERQQPKNIHTTTATITPYERMISPQQQVVYRKHWGDAGCHAAASQCGSGSESSSNDESRHRRHSTRRHSIHLKHNKLIYFVFLIVLNQLTHLFGASTFTGVVVDAAGSSGSAAATLRIEDLYQNDEGGGGMMDNDSSSIDVSSSEDTESILISSNLNSDNLYLINNKTLTPYSLSSANLVTAASIGDNPSPSVVIGGSGGSNSGGGSSVIGSGGHYLDKIDNLERSVAAVLIKVAYGTTSTTKRSIPDNSYVPSLTTIATPPLTTLRYLEKSQHQQQINLHRRTYELDLERDHALPTSAPNADILKSNSNPTYPNPNRHHNHDRHRHLIANSTPAPSIHNLQKKGPPTNSMYSIDMPSYSPPARSFLTPPLPPEYTNPFADKPTLRGTNNDGGLSSVGVGAGGGGGSAGSGGVGSGTYLNRRPIPPPSLMPGQERIPLRPPDLNGGSGGTAASDHGGNKASSSHQHPEDSMGGANGQRKKALNTPSQKVNNKMDSNGYDKGLQSSSGAALPDSTASNEGGIGGGMINPTSGNSGNSGGSGIRFQGISRILSGSNGRKEDIPEVLLRTATVRPSHTPLQQSPINHQSGNGQNPNINQSKNGKGGADGEIASQDTDGMKKNREMSAPSSSADDDAGTDEYGDNFEIFVAAEPQPKIKMSTKSTENPNRESSSASASSSASSTQPIHNIANQKSLLLTTSTPGGGGQQDNVMTKPTAGSASSGGPPGGGTTTGGATWSVAWNIHVYLSAILFTILAVYSIFKMIFYDKLTHLFNQSYFICIHLLLIVICMTRIFYLCYDAYNIHSSFHLFISEILLNLPATFLTIAFSVLILFLLIRSLNHKNNRYSALIRPLTVVVGSSVHVGLCITLHYVESYTTANNQQLYYQQQQLYRGTVMGSSGGGSRLASVTAGGHGHHHHHHQLQIPPAPPRVLSLICQIIYIFVCLSLGLLYLYLYRILKRVLRSKSQNYIHGYQNLSYAIHITIATALLFVLLAALQIYGALSISTTRPLITVAMEIDWLQWGYQFSLRLIEIAIITLMSWVAGLKTGGNSAGGVLQREKAGGGGGDTHNVSGFALFPCTSSSSQEHFETDYPAVCNANTNLHTYTLRTGKPIYDDNFALNSLGAGTGVGNSSSSGGSGSQQSNMTQPRLPHDYQLQNPTAVGPGDRGDFMRSYETSSMRSASHHFHHGHSPHILDTQSITGGSNFLCDSSQTDHYENPNFELRGGSQTQSRHHHQQQPDNCYSEPTNPYGGSNGSSSEPAYDFQDLERPIFGGGSVGDGGDHGHVTAAHHLHGARPSSRTDTHLKSLKSQNTVGRGGGGVVGGGYQQPPQNILDRANYENPERRSSNSTHSCGSTRNYPAYNSFDRRNGGVRKSGTLNNIGGHNGGVVVGGPLAGGRNNSTSSSSSSSHRPSGVQTLSSAHNRNQNSMRQGGGRGGADSKQTNVAGGGGGGGFYRGSERSHHHHRSSLERSNSSVMHPHQRQQQQLQNPQQQQYAIPSSDDADDFCCPNPERATLINNSSSSGGLSASGRTIGENGVRGGVGGAGGISSTASGGNLADIGGVISTSTSSSGGDSANSGSMLVAEHGFVRFRALDDMNNAQGVGIHNASIRASGGGGGSGVGGVNGVGAGAGIVSGVGNTTNSSVRHKEKQRCFTNNT